LDMLLASGLPNKNTDRTGLIQPVLDTIDVVCSDRLGSIAHYIDEDGDSNNMAAMLFGDAAHHLEVACMIVDGATGHEVSDFAREQDTESRDMVPESVWVWSETW